MCLSRGCGSAYRGDRKEGRVSQPFALQPEQGRSFVAPTGDSVTVLAGEAETGGAMSITQIVVAPLNGPRLHRHSRDDELWYVLDGEFRFKAGGQMLHASTGGMAYGPKGIAHCFQNIGSEPGRLLIVTAPAGLDRFFEDWESRRPNPDDLDVWNEVGAPYGLEFVGPPLRTSDPI
jgi:mannose-6-phosphate isomerase-like protein (cupin superfamily)